MNKNNNIRRCSSSSGIAQDAAAIRNCKSFEQLSQTYGSEKFTYLAVFIVASLIYYVDDCWLAGWFDYFISKERDRERDATSYKWWKGSGFKEVNVVISSKLL